MPLLICGGLGAAAVIPLIIGMGMTAGGASISLLAVLPVLIVVGLSVMYARAIWRFTSPNGRTAGVSIAVVSVSGFASFFSFIASAIFLNDGLNITNGSRYYLNLGFGSFVYSILFTWALVVEARKPSEQPVISHQK